MIFCLKNRLISRNLSGTSTEEDCFEDVTYARNKIKRRTINKNKSIEKRETIMNRYPKKGRLNQKERKTTHIRKKDRKADNVS